MIEVKSKKFHSKLKAHEQKDLNLTVISVFARIISKSII